MDERTADVATPDRPSVRGLLTTARARRAALTVLAFLAGSLILPAATKQWSDRPLELALKNDAVARITESTSDTILTSICIVQFCMAEVAPLRDGSLTLDSVDPDLFADAQVAVSREVAENSRSWHRSRELTDAFMTTYFTGTDAAQRWTAYAEAVTAFHRLGDLAEPSCEAERDADRDTLEVVLPDVPDAVWAAFPDCWSVGTEEFEEPYAEIGGLLLEARGEVTRSVLAADVAGFSSGVGDFLRDLWPL